MIKELSLRGLKFSIIFGVLFFILNYFSGTRSSLSALSIRTILAILSFFVLYVGLFAIFNSEMRKVIYSTTLSISLVIFILLGGHFFTVKIELIIGLIVGILAGAIWELIHNKRGGRVR
ncbi:hypothetical protein HMPREF2582_10380 [Staphylococcus sp. HMSC062A05]|uniref:hypothetical protein n=1 Tax=Staphylococcus sp. HMSC062A05 TaxID=1715061 RepID=UPI0008AA1DC8|nr:hypothetical protein [Staphylococcus sp. HMSC062A05]OHP67301.1 hypothetical protein HMPREF2582_10380 [Staphylococcus sp. HMSC062A05]